MNLKEKMPNFDCGGGLKSISFKFQSSNKENFIYTIDFNGCDGEIEFAGDSKTYNRDTKQLEDNPDSDKLEIKMNIKGSIAKEDLYIE